MGNYTALEIERQGHVGWLIFNRPESGNAMNAAMMGELQEAWRELDEDPAVRVIVNTGNGKAFQTGVDVVQIARDKEAMRPPSSYSAMKAGAPPAEGQLAKNW